MPNNVTSGRDPVAATTPAEVEEPQQIVIRRLDRIETTSNCSAH